MISKDPAQSPNLIDSNVSLSTAHGLKVQDSKTPSLEIDLKGIIARAAELQRLFIQSNKDWDGISRKVTQQCAALHITQVAIDSAANIESPAPVAFPELTGNSRLLLAHALLLQGAILSGQGTPQAVSNATSLAIAAYRLNPHNPAIVRLLQRAIKSNCGPEGGVTAKGKDQLMLFLFEALSDFISRSILPYTEQLAGRVPTSESARKCAAWAMENGAAVALARSSELSRRDPRRFAAQAKQLAHTAHTWGQKGLIFCNVSESATSAAGKNNWDLLKMPPAENSRIKRLANLLLKTSAILDLQQQLISYSTLQDLAEKLPPPPREGQSSEQLGDILRTTPFQDPVDVTTWYEGLPTPYVNETTQRPRSVPIAVANGKTTRGARAAATSIEYQSWDAAFEALKHQAISRIDDRHMETLTSRACREFNGSSVPPKAIIQTISRSIVYVEVLRLISPGMGLPLFEESAEEQLTSQSSLTEDAQMLQLMMIGVLLDEWGKKYTRPSAQELGVIAKNQAQGLAAKLSLSGQLERFAEIVRSQHGVGHH